MRDRMITLMQRSWNAIAPDLLGLTEDGGYTDTTFTRAEVIELTRDADHMDFGDDPEAKAAFEALPEDEQATIAREAFPYETYGW